MVSFRSMCFFAQVNIKTRKTYLLSVGKFSACPSQNFALPVNRQLLERLIPNWFLLAIPLDVSSIENYLININAVCHACSLHLGHVSRIKFGDLAKCSRSFFLVFHFSKFTTFFNLPHFLHHVL